MKLIHSCKNSGFFFMLTLFLSMSCYVYGQGSDVALEKLLFEDIPTVISASGRSQNLSEVSHSMSVITSEDIRRSGARTLTDLFISVPGIQTRNSTGFSADVSVRGDPGLLTTRDMLILLDGAVVFNPVFNGTYWNTIPVALEEIERIEVIRGPGGVLYTSNAVSGVINIITKSAKDTGSYSKITTGNLHMGSASSGIKLASGEKGGARVSYAYNTTKGFSEAYTGNIKTFIRRNTTGIRADYNYGNINLTTLARYNSNLDKSPRPTAGLSEYHGAQGVYALNLTHNVNDIYSYRLNTNMVYHSNTGLNANDFHAYSYNAVWQNDMKIDFLGDHIFSLGLDMMRHEIKVPQSLLPCVENTQNTVSFFINEEYRPAENLIFTIGSRADNHSNIAEHYENWIFSPRASIVYLADQKNKYKASVTRNYFYPSIMDRYGYFQIFPGFTAAGVDSTEPEKLTAYEVGYTGLFINDQLKFDTQFFYHKREEFCGFTDSAAQEYINMGGLNKWGAEIETEYYINNDFSVYMDYSVINGNYREEETGNTDLKNALSNISNYQTGLGTKLNIQNWKFNLYAKYVKGFSNLLYLPMGTTNIKVNGFYKTYFRAAYSFSLLDKDYKDAEFEFVLRDFINKHDFEDTNRYFREPIVYAGLRVDF